MDTVVVTNITLVIDDQAGLVTNLFTQFLLKDCFFDAYELMTMSKDKYSMGLVAGAQYTLAGKVGYVTIDNLTIIDSYVYGACDTSALFVGKLYSSGVNDIKNVYMEIGDELQDINY